MIQASSVHSRLRSRKSAVGSRRKAEALTLRSSPAYCLLPTCLRRNQRRLHRLSRHAAMG